MALAVVGMKPGRDTGGCEIVQVTDEQLGGSRAETDASIEVIPSLRCLPM